MNSKQWTWIYSRIKKCFGKHTGRPPDDPAVSDFLDTYVSIMEVTEKSREESPELDRQITAVFKMLFDIMQALEMEKKPL